LGNGVNYVQGCFVTTNITIRSSYPSPTIRITSGLYNIITINNTRYTNRYKMYKDTIISNPRAKHAPSGFNPTWTAFTGNLTTQALKDKASDASPSGILNTCLPTPHNDYLDYEIFNEA
jgi:hypothetical protein